MERPLPVVTAATAGVIGLIVVLSWPGAAQQRLQAVAQDASRALQEAAHSLSPQPGQIAGLDASPRIIHVPPNFGDVADRDYEGDVLAPARPVDRDKPQHIAPSERILGSGEPKPQQELPPRSERDRAPPAKGSLTPVYPTPRWNIGRQPARPGPAQADAQTPR